MLAVALVLGAGSGTRLDAAVPKAFARVAGLSLLGWSARALARVEAVGAIVCVVPEGHESRRAALRDTLVAAAGGRVACVAGGATRQASVARGLEAASRLLPEADWVLTHDAARCLVEPADVEGVLAAARATGAAVPVIPAADTIKEVEGDRVVRTPERSRLFQVQTPQAFRIELLREALDKAQRDGFLGTDDASLVERLGVPVCTCPGRRGNWKVTYREDLERAAAILGARSPQS